MITLTIQICDEVELAQLQNRLRGEKDIKITGSLVLQNVARDAEKGIVYMKKMLAAPPDVTILDVEILRQAAALNVSMVVEYARKCPDTRTIIIGDRFHEQNVIAMMKGGARGFLLRENLAPAIVKCIHVVAAGEIWLEGNLVGRVFDELLGECQKKTIVKGPTRSQVVRMNSISKREMEILEFVSESMTNEEIAQKLFLSAKTVKTHIRNIFEKTGIRNRVEAALLYTRYKAETQH